MQATLSTYNFALYLQIDILTQAFAEIDRRTQDQTGA